MPTKKRITKLERLIKEHFEHHSFTHTWDYYCVAHNYDEFWPKYMKAMGEGPCHNQMADAECSEYCRQCPQPCPVEGCNDPKYWDDEIGMYRNDPAYEQEVKRIDERFGRPTPTT